MPVIDMAKVSTEAVLVTDGKYPATISKAKAGKSQAGNPKIDLIWKINDDETVPEQFRGARIYDTLTFSAESLWRVKLVLTALGMGEITVDTDELVELAAEMMDQEACITVGQEPGRGVDGNGDPRPPRNRVVKTESIEAYEPVSDDEEDEDEED